MSEQPIVVSMPLGFQASWRSETTDVKAFVVEPHVWDSLGATHIAPRYIALKVGDDLRINIEDTAIAERIIAALTDAVAEKRRLDEVES
jgi:hypothetical protein